MYDGEDCAPQLWLWERHLWLREGVCDCGKGSHC